MSDSEHSTITYTSISSDDRSLDVGSPREPPLPDFVSEPVYPEFMPPEDDVLPAEEQPLPTDVLPTADSLGYIIESDPEEDPEEDDEDPEENPADYPTDRDDDDKEEEEESSKDDANDKEEDKDEDEEEEEEHLPSADSVSLPVYCTTARMSIRDQTPIPFPFEAEVDRLLAISTPPPSPLTSYSSPLPQIPSPPLPVSSPLPILPPLLPDSPTYPSGYKAAMIRLRAKSPSTSHPLPLPLPIVLPHTRESMAMTRTAAPSTYILAPRSETPPSGTPPLLPIPLPTSSPPFLLPSTDYRADVPEIGESSSAPTARPTGGFRAEYGFVGTLDTEIRHDLDREIGYVTTDIWEDPNEIIEEIPSTDVAELGQRMTNFVTTIRQDTNEIYVRLNDAHDDRSLMSGQLNLLRRDRRAHARTARLMKSKARASREAWVQSMDASDMARSKTTGTTHRGTDSTKDIVDSDGKNDTNEKNHKGITSHNNHHHTCHQCQFKALIEQGIPDAFAARDADRSQNGDDNHNSGTGSKRTERTARECTYTDFLKCQPMNFKGTEGVIALLCGRMFPKESDKIEKYVGGLPDMIHGSVMASKLKTMQDAIEFATELMDKKIRTYAEWLILLGLVRRNLTEDLNLCALNETITMTVSVLPNATSATELAI
ncbi:hypothetical protein Tco_0257277 [Tanacetum coccineum]